MSVSGPKPLHRRGTEHLLAHCRALWRLPAADRLSAELGRELSERLVAALARNHRAERRWRGSSSP